jgi:hypothetical protein
MESSYPRILRSKERDLLESVLPPDRPGYRRYRERLEIMQVIGEGRRGAGNLILGQPGEVPDISSPLPPVVAYGVVETTKDYYTITVRECVGGQIDAEIVSAHDEEIPDHFEEKRRWTYGEWKPGAVSPATGAPVREIAIDSRSVLVIAAAEKRLWLFDGTTGMNHPLPVTGYHNELMLQRQVRDPRQALAPALLFDQLPAYTDEELRAAFVAYNASRRRVEVQSVPARAPARGFLGWLQSFLKAGH